MEKINSKIEEEGETDSLLKTMIRTSMEEPDRIINKLDNRLD